MNADILLGTRVCKEGDRERSHCTHKLPRNRRHGDLQVSFDVVQVVLFDGGLKVDGRGSEFVGQVQSAGESHPADEHPQAEEKLDLQDTAAAHDAQHLSPRLPATGATCPIMLQTAFRASQEGRRVPFAFTGPRSGVAR